MSAGDRVVSRVTSLGHSCECALFAERQGLERSDSGESMRAIIEFLYQGLMQGDDLRQRRAVLTLMQSYSARSCL